jgi:hypothetical protein
MIHLSTCGKFAVSDFATHGNAMHRERAPEVAFGIKSHLTKMIGESTLILMVNLTEDI